MNLVSSPRIRLALTLAACLFARSLQAQSALQLNPKAPSAPQPTLTVDGSHLLLNGRPFQIISGELHYVRIPREYWRDRLRKAKAMGLNTITTYAFWNVHEPRPGVFDFSGQNDIAEFIREAQQEGLHVILRPGPYVCAEWELGGYPSWLLADPKLILRSDQPAYTAAVDAWMTRLAREVTPLLAANGGPVFAVQLENEYGAFGDNRQYLENLKQTYIRAGLASGLLFTSNQADDLAKGSLPELPAAVNFGSGGAATAIEKLHAFRPDGPTLIGEYWAGWFDKWGEAHHQTDGAQEAAELRSMLAAGDSVSIYMFEGGTNFGWMNGADSHTGTDYHPDTTSYDYDAPLEENGNPRYKYNLFRQAIAQATGISPAPLPKPSPRVTVIIAPIRESASLWRNLPQPITSKLPLAFEALNQSYGYVLYRVGLSAGQGGRLQITGLHDYAQIYIDQTPIGSLDRRLGQDFLQIPIQDHAATLDILVENTGRVNYSHAIRTARAGLTGPVMLAGQPLENWEMFSLPMDNLAALRFENAPCTGPCFYRTSILQSPPVDTYFDTRRLHKGQLWIGAHNLGRFWSIGPQFALYAPAPWLAGQGREVTVFDIYGDPSEKLSSVKDPIFGPVTTQRDHQ